MIQRMLAIRSLVPLPFLNSTFTSGISQFMYCWSLAWKIFEHYLASKWNEHNCSSLNILWYCPYLDWNENWPFPVLWPLLFSKFGVFQICWHIECSILTASSFRIWNSSAGIPPLPLALLVVMLPKAPLTSHLRMSGSRWMTTPSWLSGSLRLATWKVL